MSQKQAAIKSDCNGLSSIFKKSATVLVWALMCAAVATYISAVCSYDVAVRVNVDGEPVGLIKSEEDIAGVRSEFMRTVEYASDGKYNASMAVSYDFVHTKKADYLTADEYSEILWSYVEDDFSEAYMLYMDDRQVAANPDGEALVALVDGIVEQLNELRGPAFEEVRIANTLNIEKQLCLNSMLKTVEEIDSIINPLNANKEVAAAAQAVDTDSVLRISAISASAPAFAEVVANPDVDYGLTRGASVNDFVIDYNFVNTVTVNEIIEFGTVYVEDSDNFIGNEKIASHGKNGKKNVTYEIIYDTDGTIIGRNAIREEIITPATDKIIKVGTAEIPDAIPTGTFIWPCEAPEGVTSYYGWRDLYGRPDFHLGIDIPDELGSAVWAADGGTVTWVGKTPSYGKCIRVTHANGYSTLYAHLNEVLVNEGDAVYKKQVIATMGRTGVAYGIHLHFEVRINDVTVDPIKYLPPEQ